MSLFSILESLKKQSYLNPKVTHQRWDFTWENLWEILERELVRVERWLPFYLYKVNLLETCLWAKGTSNKNYSKWNTFLLWCILCESQTNENMGMIKSYSREVLNHWVIINREPLFIRKNIIKFSSNSIRPNPIVASCESVTKEAKTSKTIIEDKILKVLSRSKKKWLTTYFILSRRDNIYITT